MVFDHSPYSSTSRSHYPCQGIFRSHIESEIGRLDNGLEWKCGSDGNTVIKENSSPDINNGKKELYRL